MKLKVDLNCDLGESYGAFTVGNDAAVMPNITSANIACGFHAGDPTTMEKTIRLAKKFHVAVGAHPGFPDTLGFGRREMKLSYEEAKNYIIYQASALQGFAKIAGLNLQHVKPHGALYNMAAKDAELAKAIIEGVKALDHDLIVFAPPKSALAENANKAKLRVAHEFFADRAYNSDGSLVSRDKPNAIIHDTKRAVERAMSAISDGYVKALNGKTVQLGSVQTICVHGDNPAAVKFAAALRIGLTKAGIGVEPVGSFI